MAVETDGGMLLWRQISDALVADLKRGELKPGARLPPGGELAKRFGVNRHTVMRAVSYLQSQGIVRIERGRGTFVVDQPIEYPLNADRRFEQNLLDSNTLPTRRLLSVEELSASPEIARPLQIGAGARVALVNIVGEGDGQPLNLNSSYFPLERIPAIGEAFLAHGFGSTSTLTFERILKPYGFAKFRRQRLMIRARKPDRAEIRLLHLRPADYVLETEVTSVGTDGTPVMHAFTRFSANRVEFALDL